MCAAERICTSRNRKLDDTHPAVFKNIAEKNEKSRVSEITLVESAGMITKPKQPSRLFDDSKRWNNSGWGRSRQVYQLIVAPVAGV